MASPALEIERLLSEIADEGATRELLDQLQEILINRPELQDYYSQVMALHTLLKFEFDLSVHQFSPLVDSQELENVVQRSDNVLPSPIVRRHKWPSLLAVIAASIAVVFSGGYWLRDRGIESPTPLAIRDADDLSAAKVETLAVLSDLTHTSLTDLTLPATSAIDVGITLCSGAVWMERGTGQSERGYMVEVPPGATILVAVDADAGVHNALAVMELDAEGRPAGGVMSFKNDKNVESDRILIGGSLIANWSERNNTPAAKYYLFTGTHKKQKATDQQWHLSDYAVLLNTPNLTYLGWDDSGYTAVPNPTGEDYYADKDYDDISAIIQIRPAGLPTHINKAIAYTPRRLAQPASGGPNNAACAFTVPPGQAALIRISSSAGWQNEVEIVDRKTAEVVWRHDNLKGSSADNGAYLIENHSREDREYFVTGRHKEWSAPKEVKPWVESACRPLRDELPSLVLGFEDGGGDEDFNDVIVHIRRILNATRITGNELF